MMLGEKEVSTLTALMRSDGASFTDLVAIAGLDPAHDLRGTDLRGVDFAGCDLAGYDFSDAMLVGASFRGAIVDGALFGRADLTGVRWPQDYVLGADGRARRQRRPQIHARQREVADALLDALKGQPPARAVAVLPPGVGKTAIVAEVVSRLTNLKGFRRGLILTDTVAERDQIVNRLHEYRVKTCDALQVERTDSIDPGVTLVETFGNYNRLLNNLDYEIRDRPSPLKITHIAFMSLPTRRRSDIFALAEGPRPVSMLAFVERAIGARIEERVTKGRFGKIFGKVTFLYGLAQALDDGLLTNSSIIDRTELIGPYRDGSGQPEYRGAAVIDMVADDFINALASAEDSDSALMIVPDVENADVMVDELRSHLRYAVQGSARADNVFELTSRIRPSDRQNAFATRGAVIVTTPAMAEHLDLRRFAIVGTLAPLAGRLRALLRNPPPGRDKRLLQVVDYAGTVAVLDASTN